MSKPRFLWIFLLGFALAASLNATVHDVSIRQIQETSDPNGDSPYVGDSVRFTGIVTAAYAQYPPFNSGFVVQDSSGAWHGVYVYTFGDTADVRIGDSVEVVGLVDEYYGLTEVKVSDLQDITVLASGVNPPQPVVLQTGEVSQEAYECVLVQVQHVVVTNPDLGYGLWEVDDGSGPVLIHSGFPYSYQPQLNDTLLAIKGPVGYSYGEFKIEPRGDFDIIQSADGTGEAWFEPNVLPANSTVDSVVFYFRGVVDTIRRVDITLPQGLAADSVVGRSAFEGASITHAGTFIIISGVEVATGDTGELVLYGMSTPSEPDTYTVTVRTSSTGTPAPIPNPPQLVVMPTDGTGIAWFEPNRLPSNTPIDSIVFNFEGTGPLPITTVVVEFPEGFTFESVDGVGEFEDAEIDIDGLTITVSNVSVDQNETGQLVIRNVLTPVISGNSQTYQVAVRTAATGTPIEIPELPELEVVTTSGSGIAVAMPYIGFVNDLVDIEIVLWPDFGTLRGFMLVLPPESLMTWSGSLELEAGFDTADLEILPTGEIVLTGFELHVGDSGVLILHDVQLDSIAAETHFTANTSVNGVDFQPIAVQPLFVIESADSTVPYVMLGKVQTPGADGVSSGMVGQMVTSIGVVTAPSGVFASDWLSIWIQDPTGGVNIYSRSGGSFQLGQLVRVTGEVKEYNGVTEIDVSNGGITVLADDYPLPEPMELRVSEPLSERHEGLLIKISGKVASTPVGAGAGQKFQLWNGVTPIDIYVYNTTGIDLSDVRVGELFEIVGIGGQYDSEEPYTAGYQLLPRFQSDIRWIGEGGYAEKPELLVSPNIFAPDLGEVLNITVKGPQEARYTLRVLDSKGRLVKTLYEGRTAPLNEVWRGDDEIGAPVPIGLYIVQLKVVRADGTIDRVNKLVVLTTP